MKKPAEATLLAKKEPGRIRVLDATLPPDRITNK
jgi:hypothetical protein